MDLPLCDGRHVSATEYLKARVLMQSNSLSSTDQDEIVGAILRLFPSVECRLLPIGRLQTQISSIPWNITIIY